MRGSNRQIVMILQQYRVLESELENLEMIYKTFSAKTLTPVTAINTESISVSKTHKFNSTTENVAIYLTEYSESIDELRLQINVIETALKCLSSSEYKIISLKYFDNLKWSDVAYKMKLSEKWCKVLRNSAIKKLVKTLPVEIFPCIFFD